MNIFERATKQKLRFASDRGDLTTEQIWDLSLTNIDKVARATNADLKNLTEESFVELRPNPLQTELKLKMEILKHIIAYKLEAVAKTEEKAQKAEKRKVLLEALEAKETDELKGLSKDEILKKLEEL